MGWFCLFAGVLYFFLLLVGWLRFFGGEYNITAVCRLLHTAVCSSSFKELRREISLNLHEAKPKPGCLLQQQFKETVVGKSTKHVKSMNQICDALPPPV